MLAQVFARYRWEQSSGYPPRRQPSPSTCLHLLDNFTRTRQFGVSNGARIKDSLSRRIGYLKDKREHNKPIVNRFILCAHEISRAHAPIVTGHSDLWKTCPVKARGFLRSQWFSDPSKGPLRGCEKTCYTTR